MNYTHIIKHKLKHNGSRALDACKWILLSSIMGTFLGGIGSFFYLSIKYVTELRETYPDFLLALPVGACVIHLLYRWIGKTASRGTNLVISTIQSDDHIPLRMAPLIMFSSVLSHLVGASVGREGAALQVGGSLGEFIARKLKLNQNDRKTMIMIGMSAAFSAMLGTPLAASIFSLEVVSVGIMHYSALMPCVIASYIARLVARYFGIPAPSFELGYTIPINLRGMFIVLLLAICSGFASNLFCTLLHRGEEVCKKFFLNEYVQSLAMGGLLLLFTYLSGSQAFNGAGSHYIHTCVAGEGQRFAFLIKILFTVVSLMAGYKGGEIVPSFFIGASLGANFGHLINFDPSLCAALGMAGVFCGVTNCPITSLLIFCEMFDFKCAPYALLMCAICYISSGYNGLYTDQKIVYSKFRLNYINKKTK